jgi:phosphoribosylformylglycinamidine (FGAM) synthase PurS component
MNPVIHQIKIACLFFVCSFFYVFEANAQALPLPNNGLPTNKVFIPKGMQLAVVENNDTIPVVFLKEVIVFPPMKFKNEKERREYDKLVRDVKKALPYAKLVYNTLIETYEYILTLPDDKSRDAHLKKMEKELFKQYKPELKKLTLSQGKLVIKLIDRECHQSSYQLVSAFLGKVRASFWNIFAGMFGASLKTDYDPKGNDAMTERIVLLVERGLI